MAVADPARRRPGAVGEDPRPCGGRPRAQQPHRLHVERVEDPFPGELAEAVPPQHPAVGFQLLDPRPDLLTGNHGHQVARNDGMNRRNVVPNRNTAPAATVLNRAVASSFPSKMFDSSLGHGPGGSIRRRTCCRRAVRPFEVARARPRAGVGSGSGQQVGGGGQFSPRRTSARSVPDRSEARVRVTSAERAASNWVRPRRHRPPRPLCAEPLPIADCRPCASPTALVVWQPPIQPGRWWG